MTRYIPGHFRACTVWNAILLASTTWLATGSERVSLGMVMIVMGTFLSDQATHLAQADHSAPPPTWIERKMQERRRLFVGLGLVLTVAGVKLMYLF